MLQAAIEVPPPSLIARYGAVVSGMTSCPETMSLDASVGDAAFRAALARSNDQLIPAPLSLYLHIPFCRALCYHCACDKKVTRNAGEVSAYLAALHREIAMKATMIDADRCVQQLHIGGGTPAYLDARQRAALMACLREHFRFEERQRRDFSIEIDPRAVAPEDMADLAEIGFNRIVLGVHDLDPDVQRAINRRCDFVRLAELIVAAREAGVRSIAVDLMCGLPMQDAVSFGHTIEQVLSLAPDAISVLDYAHGPAQFPNQRLLDRGALPDAAARTDILRASALQLQRDGYERIGMDHFAQPASYLDRARREGRLHRSFQRYASGAGNETLGLGASAISSIGDGLFQSERCHDRYRASVEAGGMAVWRGHLCDAHDRRAADVIQSIMCYLRCDKRAWELRYRNSFDGYFQTELKRLARMADDGLVRLGTRHIEVTPLGVAFMRSIAACFGGAPPPPARQQMAG